MRYHLMSAPLKPTVVLFHLVMLLSSHWIACLGLVAFDDSSVSSDDSHDNLRQGSHLVVSRLDEDSDNSMQQVSSVDEDRMDPNSEMIAVLAKKTLSGKSFWKVPYRTVRSGLKRMVMPQRYIDNPYKAKSAFKSIQYSKGDFVSKFARFDQVVMEGYSKAGLKETEASEVVVKVLNDEIGPWRAAKLLKNLESVNPELFGRTRLALYRYWNVKQLSFVDFEGGKISSMLGKGETEKAKERIFNCFSEYFKYAGQAAGREENSAYKSLMEIIENLGYGHVLDGILRSFSQPEINELLDNGRRIALDYLKKQHEKYNTPSAIIKAVPYWDKGLILMGQPFFRLRALCKTHVKVEDGAVSEVELQSKWLIDQLDDWVFDKKLFFVMYPMRRDILAATVLKQLSHRWKGEVASSIAMAQDYIKSMLEIVELKGTWPMYSIEYHAFQDFIDLAFDKPIPVQIKEAFNGQEGVDELIYKLNNAF